MLTTLAPDLFCATHAHSFMAMNFGARMTIVRMGNRLLLISPITIDDAMAKEIEELGEVHAIIAPNLFHHMYVSDAVKRFPRATLVAPRGLQKKRKDLKIDVFLDVIASDRDEDDKTWDAALLTTFEIEGQKVMQESTFLHPPSRTLITTDLVLNIKEPVGFVTRSYFKIAGYKGVPLHSPLLKMSTWSDKAAGKRSLEKILDQDWDRLILAHGDVVESGGKDALRRAFNWLLA